MGKKTKPLLFAVAAIFLFTAFLYWNSLANRPVWDDNVFIKHNTFIRDCSNLRYTLNPVYLLKVLPVPMSARPVVNASLILDNCAGPADIWNLRFTNVILHASNAALVFVLCAGIFGITLPSAFLAALLFAAHPLAAEPVNIITFRSHLLCLFFYLLAFLSAELGEKTGKKYYSLPVVCFFLLSMLSNEMGATFPLVLLVYRRLARDGSMFEKRFLIEFSLLICAAVFYLWFRFPRAGYIIPGAWKAGKAFMGLYPDSLLPRNIPAGIGGAPAPPWREIYSDWKLNLLTMMDIWRQYINTMIAPFNLSGDYTPRVIKSFSRALPSVIELSAFLAAALLLLKKNRTAAFAVFFIFIALLPAANLIPIANIKADRYLYIPLAGYALLAGAALDMGRKTLGRGVAAAGGICYLLLLLFLLFERAPVFMDDKAFFSAILTSSRSSPRAELNMAAALFSSGDIRGMEAHMRKALELAPGDPDMQLRLAFFYITLNRGPEGLKLAEAALRSSPGKAGAIYVRGLAFWRNGEKENAVKDFNAALKAEPSLFEAWTALEVLKVRKNGAATLNLPSGAGICDIIGVLDFYAWAGLGPGADRMLRGLEKTGFSAGCLRDRNWQGRKRTTQRV
ncbi:MAG: hypothetical protein A2270_07605 [Elusimicrobia bacterium RIFOXYA12_FULL_51_18]|nr:MAG: hypothetical protein A2270_07605 [Elusimicrobia bacterium RIFOXYA12_FULL_51_18]OGS29931.1 MAG: hypothetical protein A2218_12275 [Elusimicrobia bacterium RIFOXYA2_FULL_53_38]